MQRASWWSLLLTGTVAITAFAVSRDGQSPISTLHAEEAQPQQAPMPPVPPVDAGAPPIQPIDAGPPPPRPVDVDAAVPPPPSAPSR